MKHTIVDAKTVDEAVKKGLLELGVKENQVEIEVLEQASKGFLGILGAKDARVKLTLIRDIVSMSREFLEKTISFMDIDADIEIYMDQDTVSIDIVNVTSRDKGILIGKRGNTLDAIQYLLSLYINKENEDYKKVVIDIEGYREKREETLIKLANRMADKALKSRRVVKLEPMNPYERRIIHSSLQDFSGITTYSEGVDPYRRVVIQAK